MRRSINIALTVLISVGFVPLGVFVFYASYLRLAESAVDLWHSVRIYFCEILGLSHSFSPTVGQFSNVLSWDVYLPPNFEAFKSDAGSYFSLLVSRENFLGWWRVTSKTLATIGKVLIIILPVIIILYFLIRWLYRRSNNHYNRDTVPLQIFKWISEYTYQPFMRFVLSYRNFLRRHSWIWRCWIALWVFHLNVASIIVSFLAFYFYFVVSYDLQALYMQFPKLIIDIGVVIRHFPWWILLFVAWWLFNRWRRRIALGRLRHYEARNCGFINELPIVSITCGSMGKKKTTVITDMSLSQAVMFRQKALSILQNNDMKFPYFPWICFERELQACMEYGTVYNLATVKAWVDLKRRRYEKHGNSTWQLYGYDIARYGGTYDDALKISTLFEVLSTYAQAYFIYIMENSLLLANFSIRDDEELFSEGNFPTWYANFFPRYTQEGGRHAHILDFDVLRLGKKVIENNPKAGSFEFGVVVISEVGKERGNTLELKEVKKGTYEANQKNDGFNSWLKMCRHSATVDNFPFIKVFTDEQRPESWGADARDLCEIIRIISTSEQKLTYPFYTIENMISEWAFDRFINLYYDFRYRRGDNTLLVYLLKSVTAWIWRRNIRIYNRYGYSTLRIEKERGTMDKKAENKRYFLMNKKIYARRFSTDCFSDYFNDMARRTRIGLNDYREYVTEKATVEELKSQNSYFINSLYSEDADAESGV